MTSPRVVCRECGPIFRMVNASNAPERSLCECCGAGAMPARTTYEVLVHVLKVAPGAIGAFIQAGSPSRVPCFQCGARASSVQCGGFMVDLCVSCGSGWLPAQAVKAWLPKDVPPPVDPTQRPPFV